MLAESVLFWSCLLLANVRSTVASDITGAVFANVRDGMPAAFGDFNSDELTDVFVLRNGRKTVEILLGAPEEPLLRPGFNLSCTFPREISSIVPGDFDGDALMDVLVTVPSDSGKSQVFLLWGGINNLTCTESPVLTLKGQPLAIDYNQDMIIDLFGMNEQDNRTFWIFNNTRTPPRSVGLPGGTNLKLVHSHSYLDLDQDFTADLFITTEDKFEVWNGVQEEPYFKPGTPIKHPEKVSVIGQAIFADFELRGVMELVLPVCSDSDCEQSQIMVHSEDGWNDMKVDFKDNNNNVWKFIVDDNSLYLQTITLRVGDFNMDGYPDFLATMVNQKKRRKSFLLENVPCSTCGKFNRTLVVRWDALAPFGDDAVMSVFFDFYQDGILDVILVKRDEKNGNYSVQAFKNSLDYDANFIKVMVLTGLTNKNSPEVIGRLGKKKRTYGTNLPGPTISYRTTSQEGVFQHAVCAQLPQSAYFSLHLPFSIFGLGRTPNFVDGLTVGLSNRSREWTQIIPNSQMVVIPWPPKQPAKWKAQLFVTPSKLILLTFLAMCCICFVIVIIILLLFVKERKEDRKERMQESHRFHFDAM